VELTRRTLLGSAMAGTAAAVAGASLDAFAGDAPTAAVSPPGDLHLHVRRVQRGQPGRQDGGEHRVRAGRQQGRFVGGSPLTAALPTATETFTIADLGGGSVALRSAATGKYVCADQAGAAPLVADRDAIGLWETVTRVPNPDGSVSFRSAANGRYVCAEDGGAGALIANRAAIDPWESFDLV
jgi:hypothetical protein